MRGCVVLSVPVRRASRRVRTTRLIRLDTCAAAPLAWRGLHVRCLTSRGQILGYFGRAFTGRRARGGDRADGGGAGPAEVHAGAAAPTDADGTPPAADAPAKHNVHISRQRLRELMLERLVPPPHTHTRPHPLPHPAVVVECAYEMSVPPGSRQGQCGGTRGSLGTMRARVREGGTELFVAAPTDLVCPRGTGGVTLRCLSGAGGGAMSLDADVLVGADGIWSAVRSQKLGDTPRFLGVFVVLGIARVRHPLLGDRVWETLDGGCRARSAIWRRMPMRRLLRLR